MCLSGDGTDGRVHNARFYAGPMRLRRSRLGDEQSERLLEHFVAGTPARAAAGLAGVNRNTARLFYHRVRETIAQQLERASPVWGEAVSTGAEQRTLREAAPGVPVFGLVSREGKVHTVLIHDGRPPDAPVAAAETGVPLDAIVYYAGSSGERGALAVTAFHQQRVDDEKRPARGGPRIDSVENFWGQAKRHLRRYGGIPRQHLGLFLKECEWRFNYGSPRQLLEVLKAWIENSAR